MIDSCCGEHGSPRIIIDLQMAQLLLYELSDDLHSVLLSDWLDERSLAKLDIAVSSAASRPYWMTLLGSLRSASIDNMHHSASSLMWVIHRGICASRVHMKVDSWRVPGCDLSLLKTFNLLHLELMGCSSVTDECIVKAVVGCSKRVIEDGSICDMIRVAGVSALSQGCGQLQSINLRGSSQVADAGVSVLSAGCGQLLSIDLTGCRQVTDAGISASGAGCGQLQSIDLRGCRQVTDAGISALSQGCGQLQSINLSFCHQVTDTGVSALGAGCGQLQSVNLEGCDKVTDAGISALGAGCGQLLSINLWGCRQVTGTGVSA